MARTIATSAAGSSRNRGVLMLAVVFGIVSALLMFAYLNSKGGGKDVDKALNSGAGAETVVVVSQDIAMGQKITSDMLTTKTIPGGALLSGRFSNAKDLEGKLATQPMYVGEQVTAAKVTSDENQTTIAYKVPAGTRAMGLMVPHEGWIVGGLPQPGDRVDVVGITLLTKTDPLTGKDQIDLVSGIIAQNVEVLAVGQSLVKRIPNVDADKKAQQNGEAAPASSQAGSAPGDGESREKSLSVSLALTPEQAAKVAMIDAMRDDEGQWRIIVRKTGESEPVTGQLTWSLEDVFTFTKKK